jgi:glucosylceramidase
MMMKHQKLLTLIFWLFLATACSKSSDSPVPVDPNVEVPVAGKVQSYTTSSSQLSLLKLKNVDFGGMPGDFTIRLDSTATYQQMDGFGAALTGSSAYLLNMMDAAKRTGILRDLFDPQTGIGISYLRITIGSSDFSLGNYSYWDTEGAAGFSIPLQDSKDLIPILKEIVAINPKIKIMASPWSAPAWMKGSKTMNGGSLLDANMPAYADYFVKYVKAYKQMGINIDAISVQNEPAHQTSGYPTMLMIWQQQAMFIKAFLKY